MGDTEIEEIVGDSELVNNDYILIDDFAKMIMNRIWKKKVHLKKYWLTIKFKKLILSLKTSFNFFIFLITKFFKL